MNNFKYKKIVLAALGIAALAVIVLYTYVGSFVLQVFPREDTKPEAPVASAENLKASDALKNSNATLGEIDEKPEQSYTLTPAPPADNARSTSKRHAPPEEKSNSDRRHFNFFGLKL